MRDKTLVHFAIRLVSILILSMIANSSLFAQNVEIKGRLKATFIEKRASLPGSERLVPAFNEYEGLLILSVNEDALKFFKPKDIIQWFRGNDVRVFEVRFDESKILERDNKVRVRFNYDFLPGESLTSKRLEINTKEFQMGQLINLYKNEIVYYELSIEEEPKYDRDIFGSLQIFIQNVDDVQLSVRYPDATIKTLISSGNVTSLSDLKPGQYQVTVKKKGFVEQKKSVSVVAGSNPAALSFSMEQEKVKLTIRNSTSGYDVLLVPEAGASINRLNQPKNTIVELTPGKYQLRLSKNGYRDITREVDISSGSPKSISVSMAKGTNSNTGGTRPNITSNKKGNNTWWYILLAAVVGGGGYYAYTQLGGSSGGGYGSPPALPTPITTGN